MADDQPFLASIETDAGTYLHTRHLGTVESVARDCVEEIWRHRIPKVGTMIATVALMRDGKIHDVFDGEWHSDLIDHDFDFYTLDLTAMAATARTHAPKEEESPE